MTKRHDHGTMKLLCGYGISSFSNFSPKKTRVPAFRKAFLFKITVSLLISQFRQSGHSYGVCPIKMHKASTPQTMLSPQLDNLPRSWHNDVALRLWRFFLLMSRDGSPRVPASRKAPIFMNETLDFRSRSKKSPPLNRFISLYNHEHSISE